MDLQEKYAKFLVFDCLKLKKNQLFLIVADRLNESFVMKVMKEAKKISDQVKILYKDAFLERDLYLHQSWEVIVNHPLFDREIYNEVAKDGGAILTLVSPIPNINDGISGSIIQRLAKELEKRIKVFREYQQKGLVPWCIAAAANDYWAKEILNDQANSEDLWQIIYKICHIDEDDPIVYWNQYFEQSAKRCALLNKARIKSFHYESENGTDLVIELPKSYIFQSAKDSYFIANMPSLEIFVTPKKDGVKGVVYSSKPLFHHGVMIDDFCFHFQEGKIVSYDAKLNLEYLKEIIETDEGSHYLGEVALVDYDSNINQTGLVFEETLLDENACCHLAIGQGFSECFADGLTKTLSQLKEMGMNESLKHVDFMIGTRDLKITAQLEDGTEMKIMEQGKLLI